MAIVSADYTFACVGTGGSGKNSDGSIFENLNMGQRFEVNLMNVSDEKNFPEQNQPCPHVLVGLVTHFIQFQLGSIFFFNS